MSVRKQAAETDCALRAPSFRQNNRPVPAFRLRPAQKVKSFMRPHRLLALLPSGLPFLALAAALLVLQPGLTQPAHAAPGLIHTMDVDETVDWYRDKLGFRVVSDVTRVQARAVVLERSGFLLEITEDDRVAATPAAAGTDVEVTGSAEGPAVDYLVANVDAELDRVRARGVEVVAEPQDELDGRFRTALIRDNGGRLVQLREPLGSGGDSHDDGI